MLWIIWLSFFIVYFLVDFRIKNYQPPNDENKEKVSDTTYDTR